MDFVVELGKWFVIAYLVILLGRAVAARIAGNNAQLVLGSSLMTINIHLPEFLQHMFPLPRRSSDDDQESDEETGNTETPGNTGNTTVSAVSEYMTVNDSSGSRLVKRMTKDEFDEFVDVRNDALDLLRLCIEYHRLMHEPDDGLIPHYSAFKKRAEMNTGIGADTRGKIVKNLEYSGLVSVIDRKSTRVVPAIDIDSGHPIIIGSCSELVKLITRGRVWVYPDGYNERKQALLDSAVAALPGNER